MKLKTEADVCKYIKNALPVFCNKVIYTDRLNSGSIHSGRTHINMCKKGTPDLYAILDHDGGHVLFIECKKPDGGKQSEEQIEFEGMLNPFTHIHYILARSLMDVTQYIRKNIVDFYDF